MSFDFDHHGYNQKVRQFAALNRQHLGAAVRDETRLLIAECINRTPPVHGATLKGGGQSVGRKAVTRDIRRIFKPAHTLDLWEKSPSVRRLVREQNISVLDKMFKNARGFAGVAVSPERAWHYRQRNSRGRTRQGRWKLILNEESIRNYTTSVWRMIGYGRSGWKAAANRFGVRLENWVARHNGAGMANDRTHGTETPIAEGGNLVRYMQQHGRKLGIMRAALRSRHKSLENKVTRLVNRTFTESNKV